MISDFRFLLSENRISAVNDRDQEGHFGEPPLQRTPATVATATPAGKLISAEANSPQAA